MYKINSAHTNKYGSTYSQFFNAFEKQLLSILNSRPISKDTYKSYIKNPSTETAIRRFVQNSEKGLLIIKGPQGSGKSSTLYAMHREFNYKLKTYSSVLVDLLQYISSIPEDLGDIETLDRQVAACVPSARRLITSSFQRKAERLLKEEKLDRNSVFCEVFRYIYDFHFHIVPAALAMPKFREMNDDELIKLVYKNMEENFKFQGSFYFTCFVYCLSKYKKKKKIVIILDNGDHLPYAFLEAVTLCANQYSGYLAASNDRHKNDSRVIVGKIHAHFLIACRFHNYEKLSQRASLNALGAHYHEDINHLGFNNIGDAVSRRIRNIDDFSEYTFKGGIRLTPLDAKKCIKAYFKQLELSGCLLHLTEIHNHNISNMFDALKKITQNKHYPRFDDFVAEYLIDRKIKKQFKLPINIPIMHRCIVRGNPENISQAIYPTAPNDIPNLFSWDGQDPTSFLLKPRIIKILQSLGVSSEGANMAPIATLYKYTNEIFSISEKAFLLTINEMLSDNLLFSYAHDEINSLNYYAAVTLSSRSEYILENISRNHVIPLAFMEDFYIPKSDVKRIGLQSGVPIQRQSKLKIAEILSCMFDIEIAQLQNINDRGKIELYRALVSEESFVSKLKHGLMQYLTVYIDPDAELLRIKEDAEDSAIADGKNIDEKEVVLSGLIGKSKGFQDILASLELDKNSIPVSILIEKGIQVVVENYLEEDLREKILEIMAEIGNQIENNTDETAVKKNLDRFSDAVKQGKNFETVSGWANDFVEKVTEYFNAGGQLPS